LSKDMRANIAVEPSNYDIVISGGGVVGCLMALALAKTTDFTVLLLEANAAPPSVSPRFDARVIALASESLNTLASLGIDIDQIPYQAIAQIHVSDKGHLGQVRLHASDYGIDALGKVVAIDALGQYLLEEVKTFGEQITYLSPVKIEQVKQSASKADITLSNDASVAARLLIVSDGGQSKTASLLGMQTEIQDYAQSAIITNISTQLAHNNVAYERFTSQGPIAFLPMNVSQKADDTKKPSNRRTNSTSKQHNDSRAMSIVWCTNTENVDAIMALSEEVFLQKLNTLFGYKLGKLVSCSQRFSYPLALVKNQNFVLNRAESIGNAAQTLHPIAGQGFNLGVRDVEALVSVLKTAKDPGSFDVMHKYKQARHQDKQASIGITNSLLRIFSNKHFPLVVGRNLALMGLNKSSLLKRQFAHFAMGLRN
jgi:2-octaprenyl-6-methoxyphenol hydroxylase